jgi:hypothetical protein
MRGEEDMEIKRWNIRQGIRIAVQDNDVKRPYLRQEKQGFLPPYLP